MKAGAAGPLSSFLPRVLINKISESFWGVIRLEKNKEAGSLVLPYLEEELQPKRLPTWMLVASIAFGLGALLFPFYA